MFREILCGSGISFEPLPPYIQHKNGVSERMIRTIVTKARVLLLDSCLEDEFWAEAVNTAVYLHARSQSRSVGGFTPYEKLFGVKPELGRLRRFGCTAYKPSPEVQRAGKFAERAKKCVFLGYVHEMVKIWPLWDAESKRVIQAMDIQFAEAETIGKCQLGNEDQLDVLRSCIPDGRLVGDDQTAPVEEVICVIAPNAWGEQVTAPNQTAPEYRRIVSPDSSLRPEEQGPAVTTVVSDLSPQSPPAPVLRRSG